MIPENILQEIMSKKNIVLITHTHPDGDALGSLFGLASILDSLGKKVFCFLEEPVSHLYDFLPEINRAVTSFDEYRLFVKEAGSDLLTIALDCGDKDRLGKLRDEVLKKTPFLVIDHHRSHTNFGTARWVDDSRSSTGEMVYELAMALESVVSYNCAYNLYVAICTDTGSFKYENTGSRTMRIAGELLERGVKPEVVGNHLYDNYTPERLKLLELTLATTTLCEENQVAIMYVTPEILEKSGAVLDDVEGFIDFPRSLKMVKVAVLIKETKNGKIAVSLRAKGECNVAEVAKKFGGGGHRNAAGFKRQGVKVDRIRSEILPVLRDALICALNK